MSGWPVLDVAIGLIFIYLLLSLICTTINEGLMTQFRSRAKFLDKGILSLLGSPEVKKDFFEHPLIRSYHNTKGDSVFRRIGRRTGMKSATSDQCPSYLSGFAFARAVHDMLKDPGSKTVIESIQKRVEAAEMASGNIKKNDENQKDKTAKPDRYHRLREILRAVLVNAENPDEELALLNKWYEDGMDRVTGWYKRHTQAWVRVLAIAVTLVMNADTIRVSKTLWTDPTVRAKVLELAKSRVERTKSANYQMDDSGTPNETKEVGTGRAQTIGDFGGEITDDERQAMGDLMGWDKEWLQREELRNEKGQIPWSKEWEFARSVVVEHWLGWLFTMVALSLGAPFWFDLLKRVMNIRNAGATPNNDPGKINSPAGAQNAA